MGEWRTIGGVTNAMREAGADVFDSMLGKGAVLAGDVVEAVYVAMEAKSRKCGRCNSPATRQTAKGSDAEASGHLPVNHGYYCDKCYEEGLRIEEEAMYG